MLLVELEVDQAAVATGMTTLPVGRRPSTSARSHWSRPELAAAGLPATSPAPGRTRRPADPDRSFDM